MIYLMNLYINYIIKGEAFIDVGAFGFSMFLFTMVTLGLVFSKIITFSNDKKIPSWIYIAYVVNTIMTFAIPLMFVVK